MTAADLHHPAANRRDGPPAATSMGQDASGNQP